MKNQNICKFPVSIFESKNLNITCFVRETNEETMRTPFKLPENRMILIAEGGGVANLDGLDYKIRGGNLLFCMQGEVLAVTPEVGLVYMYVGFEGARSEELFRRFDVTPLSRIYSGFEGLIPFWQESLFKSMEKNLDLTAESLLLFTFSKLESENGAESGLIAKIIEITEESFGDYDLNISLVAERLSYHPKYLSHLFKTKTGVTYSEYLRSVRMKYATMLFDRGLDSVKNVAQLSGYSDPFYFSNVFKKSVGTSPKEYILSVNNSK